jgi:hypothetical protein
MPATTISSREFNRDTGRAKKPAKDGPVFNTDRGVPAHVLLCIEDYQRLVGGQVSLIVRVASPPGVEDVAFETPVSREASRPAHFG